jgi:hypothetical protein
MRTTDIKPDTVVYAAIDGSIHSLRARVVVLDTARWTPIHDGSARNRIVGYQLDDRTYRGKSYASDSGLLTIQAGGRGAYGADNSITDADLIDIAAAALPALRAGELPELPKGVRVRIATPRHIESTWAEHEAAQARRRARSDAEQAARAERAREQNEARARLTAVLGEDNMRSAAVMGIAVTELERLCVLYAERTGMFAEQAGTA